MIVVLDFGSQYSRLISRRVRELNVYTEILPGTAPWEEISARQPEGIILSGGPASVYEEGAPRGAGEIFSGAIPVLGICYGLQLLVEAAGGSVEPGQTREYGPAQLRVTEADSLFSNLPSELDVWMSHGDRIADLPPGYRVLAQTDNAPFAAITDGAGKIGIQFHPEVRHTPLGMDILRNFALGVCQADADWTPQNFIESSIETLQRSVGQERCSAR